MSDLLAVAYALRWVIAAGALIATLACIGARP